MTMFSQIVLTFLLNAAWQVVAIAGTAKCCDWLLHKASAHVRHGLWVVALMLCLLLPMLSVVGLFRAEEVTTAPQEMIAIQVETGETTAPSASSVLNEFIRHRPRTFTPTPVLTTLALGCCLLSLLLHTVQLWRAWRRTTVLLAQAYAREAPSLLAAIKAHCQNAFGLRDISLCCSSHVAAPVTVGMRTILLPESFFACDAGGVLTAALGHEMAHLKRRDFACNLLYELLSLPLAFHPAITFIKRQIKQTRELACDEMVTERLLDAPTYARALLVLADTMTNFRPPTFSVGVLDADILEERIMKLIQPRLSKRAGFVLLTTALLALLLSSALAMAFSLNVEQSNAQSITGEWEMYWREDGKDPKGTLFEYSIGLHLRLTGNQLSGEAIFPRIIDHGDGPKRDGESAAPLLKAQYRDNQLSFLIEGDQKDDFMEIKLQRDGETFTGRWTILKEKESGSIKMTRKAKVSQIEKIIGEWIVQVFNRDGEPAEREGEGPLLIVKAEGNKLTAKTIFTMDGERKEWTLLDPHFEGEAFLFKLDNGEEFLEGKLWAVSDHFSGDWKGSQSGVSGTIKLLRKK